jgi:protein O-mannosyl-transferase
VSRKHSGPKPARAAARTLADRWIYLALLLAILAVFAQTGSHDFVTYDDRIYVGDNPHVRDGFSWEGVAWAFTSLDDSNWFPLTRLSHMLDCQLFGLDAGWHHWTNIVLHAASSLLLFALLKRMTAARWPSAFVAFAFALHPLHVESVAWVAERKDVLSAFFWFVTMWAYLDYVERPSPLRYALVLAAFVCGLMSKPMIVTLPFALLLVDYWPLRRLSVRAALEKIPLIALSLAGSIVTFLAQSQGHSVARLARFPLELRIENVLISYVAYLGKFFWPSKLAFFYPYPDVFPAWQWILATMVLAAVTVLALIERNSRPYLITGWFWYLGTLVPVIGLVQVGQQTRADRYTYIPMIGVTIMIAWAAAEAPRFRRQIVCGAAVAAVAWFVLTWRDLEYWQNSETLFTRAINVTEQNYVAYNNLGDVRRRQGRLDDAVSDFAAAVRIQPGDPEAQDNLGAALTIAGRTDEAIPHLQEAIRVQPDYAKAHVDLGSALVRAGRIEDALAEFHEALRLDPENRGAEYQLAGVLMMQGHAAEAMPHFERALPYLIDAVRRDPSDADNHYNLGGVYDMMGRASEAVQEFSTATRLRPDDPEIRFNLALALASASQPDRSIEQFRAAIHLRPDYAEAHFELARVLAAMGRKAEAAAEFSQTLKLDPSFTAAAQQLQNLQSSR